MSSITYPPRVDPKRMTPQQVRRLGNIVGHMRAQVDLQYQQGLDEQRMARYAIQELRKKRL